MYSSTGTHTWEPLNIIGKCDEITLAKYAKDNDLLSKPGWKFLRKTAKRQRFLNVALNALKRRRDPTQLRYKFGVRLPRNYAEALRLDQENGSTLWADAVTTELDQIRDYDTIRDMGIGVPIDADHHKINVRLVFDVKASGKRKGRLVARGDLTPEPDEAVYSSVASLRSLRTIIFLSELNNLQLWQGDIGNAYLESYTQEKVYFIAGPEFGPLQGHTMKIIKALYGLCSSGLRFHERLSTVLQDFGFTRSYADPDVWMREGKHSYEYIVVYVDDLIVAMMDPKLFFDQLQAPPVNFKLKGVAPANYHLGGDLFRDDDGTLCFGSQTYSKRLVANFESLFNEAPKPSFSPLDHEDRPELDTSPLCGPDDTAKFQSLVGACQWMISLCRLDLAHAIMSLSRFRHAPRQGHLDRLMNVCGYIRKFPQAAIRIQTGIPNHEATFGEYAEKYDWMETVYGTPTEELPPNMPTPKGNVVRTTTYFDANLMHDVITGRSASGILHFLNQTPWDWFSKRQAHVETATYGSEFMAARQAIEQIIDLRYTLHMFAIPIDGASWLFGDNKSVVTSSTIPHSSLGKRWNALSYHRCREAVAAGIVRFHHIAGEENPSDLLTKPLPHYKARVHLEPLLFWKGETNPDIGNQTTENMSTPDPTRRE